MDNNGIVLLLFIYIYLLLLRLVVTTTITYGYIHPDEYYQSGQELFFGSSSTEIWDFHPSQGAIRSIYPPLLMTYIPIQIYKNTIMRVFNNSNELLLSGYEIWIIPRIFCSLLSILFVDYLIVKIILSCLVQQPRSTTSSKATLLLLVLLSSSSWTSLTMLNRPFTNTIETFILSFLLYIVMKSIIDIETTLEEKEEVERQVQQQELIHKEEEEAKSDALTTKTTTTTTTATTTSSSSFMIGIICSLGFFARVTFVCYAIPIVLYYMYFVLLRRRRLLLFETTTTTTMRMKVVLIHFIQKTLIPMIIGFISTCIILICIDSVYYNNRRHRMISNSRHENDSHDNKNNDNWIWYITPLNFILYNTKTTNLSEHGLHPFYNHMLINMFIMFGPLALWFYIKQIQKMLFKKRRRRRPSNEITNNTNNNTNTTKKIHLQNICQLIIWSGLILLSFIPHQEPRFLLPLLVPLVLLYSIDNNHIDNYDDDEENEETIDFGKKKEEFINNDNNNNKETIIYENDEKNNNNDHDGDDDDEKSTDQRRRRRKQTYNNKKQRRRRKLLLLNIFMISFWILFNGILYIIYGILHQGGVIPSLLSIHEQIQIHYQEQQSLMIKSKSNDDNKKEKVTGIIYYHTYMPPTFLTRQQRIRQRKDDACQINTAETCNSNDNDNDNDGEYPILDLKGSNYDTLYKTLNDYLFCKNNKKNKLVFGSKNNNNNNNNNSNHNSVIMFLVTPPSVIETLQQQQRETKQEQPILLLKKYYNFQRILKYYPNLSTEDPPLLLSLSLTSSNDNRFSFFDIMKNLIEEINLSVYKITCS